MIPEEQNKMNEREEKDKNDFISLLNERAKEKSDKIMNELAKKFAANRNAVKSEPWILIHLEKRYEYEYCSNEIVTILNEEGFVAKNVPGYYGGIYIRDPTIEDNLNKCCIL